MAGVGGGRGGSKSAFKAVDAVVLTGNQEESRTGPAQAGGYGGARFFVRGTNVQCNVYAARAKHRESGEAAGSVRLAQCTEQKEGHRQRPHPPN